MQTLSQSIDKAVDVLRRGGLIALPTETVYGLGADASNQRAVQRIFTVKGRPSDHPLIVHIASIEMLKEWAQNIPEIAWALCSAFWPGPLTLILPAAQQVNKIVTGGLSSIGLRCPQHIAAQSVLQEFGGGIAAPSANRFGRISPTSAQDVYKELGSKIDYILEGGSCHIGIESTIVDLTQAEPQILRLGAITSNQLKTVLGKQLTFTSNKGTRAPGTLATHYAPVTKTRVICTADFEQVIEHYFEQQLKISVLSYSLAPIKHTGIKWLRMPKQAHAYAQQLYKHLRKADEEDSAIILVEQVPLEEEWAAIADRLSKAAATHV